MAIKMMDPSAPLFGGSGWAKPFEYDMKRYGGERANGESANDRGPVGASHAVN